MSGIVPRFSQELREFLIDPHVTFRIIHTITGSGVISSTAPLRPQKLFILDSSFNPPHKGHFSLIQKYCDRYTNKNNDKKPTLLLLFSVKNADKSAPPDPEVFEDRLSMIYHLSHYTAKNLGIDVAIGLTNQAKFVDKASSIHKTFDGLGKLTFLLGFDTLVRLLNPDYYKPLSLVDALDEFMSYNEVFCLTRNSDQNEGQLKFVKEVHETYPASWRENICLVENDKDVLNVSSSSIRKNVTAGDNDWEDLVIPEIKNLIKERRLYL